MSVHAGGSALLQKQHRRGRGVCLSVELGTEHDVPPAPRRPARHASCRWGLLSVEDERQKLLTRERLAWLSPESTDSAYLPPRHPRTLQLVYRTSELVTRSGLPPRHPRRQQLVYSLRARRQERLASETPEETAARRQRDRDAHTHRPPPVSAQPFLHQPGVRARMRKFHSQLASLEVSTCTTCLERFPGMTTRCTAAGTECVRCHRDTHSPKAYSWENNMHPGPVPMQLEVGVDSHCLSHLI